MPRAFTCEHCGVEVSLDAPGTTHRNHCPACLWSRHLDRNVPGDRKADCAGDMEPIAVTVRTESRWVLIHRCTNCGRLRLNKKGQLDMDTQPARVQVRGHYRGLSEMARRGLSVDNPESPGWPVRSRNYGSIWRG